MESTASRISAFAGGLAYSDLPEPIVDYAKILILDSVICGLAAATMARSRMIHSVLQRMGGRGDAAVFGMPARVPAPLAAAANAEIMNLLDADDLFRGHFAVINTAVALAEAQRAGATGRDMIRAFSLGWEVNARLAVLQPPGYSVREDGSIDWRSGPGGITFAATGATVTAAALAGLDPRHMAHAVDLSAWKAPVPVHIDYKHKSHWTSFKYANYFDVAQSSILAAYLAEAGYVGDGTAMDSPWSHLRMVGIEPEAADFRSPAAPSDWLLMRSALKLYPACRFLAPLIDVLRSLVAEHAVDPNNVEEVAVSLHPAAEAMGMCHLEATHLEPDHRMPLALAFNVRYLLALVLLRIPPGPAWFAESLASTEPVRALMAKVRPYVEERAAHDLRERGRAAGLQHRVSLRLQGGGAFERSTQACRGDPDQPETRMSWSMLREKMGYFCEGSLSPVRIDETFHFFRHLEQVDDLREAALEVCP